MTQIEYVNTSTHRPRVPGLRSLLCAALLSCLALSCQNPSGPFVRIKVTGLQPQISSVRLTLSMNGTSREVDFKGEDSYSRITVDFPTGTTGQLTAKVSAMTESGCNAANGTSEPLDILEDAVYELPVPLIPEPADKCGLPAVKLTVMLQNTAPGSGTVVSMPLTINCGQICSYTYVPGTMVTLLPQPAVGSKFTGWTGGSCSGTQPCGFTITGETTVTATFEECKGWCPVNPALETSSLFSVWGTGASNMFAVGDGGRILSGNGMTWTRMTSGTTSLLRSIGSNKAGTIVAAGDNGAARFLSGGNWSTMSGTNSLRINALAAARDNNQLYALGMGGTVLRWDGNTFFPDWDTHNGGTTAAGGASMNAAFAIPTTNQYVAVGDGGKMFRGDGNNMYVAQMNADTNNLYGVYWGTAKAYAVGANGVILSRAGAMGNETWAVDQGSAGVTPQTLRAVWASADNNVIAVGDGGAIVRWNGTAWQMESSTTQKNLNGVWAPDGTTAYAVGQDGIILRYRP